MIKINELRVGNLVKDRRGKTLRIDYFEGQKVCQQMRVQGVPVHPLSEWDLHLQPIPLTPEILERCGFEEWSEGNFKTKPELNINGWSKEFNYYQPYAKLSIYTGYVEAKYLHQLQNLYYSLTQSELEVNL